MYEYSSQEDLYKGLIPAINVKLKLLKDSEYNYITKEDIWNYLKETKWIISTNLTLGEMVNDIIHLDNKDIDIYLKNKLKNEKKEIIVS
jgi:hypothetical protein